jgi:alanine-alpha-ketoisovalerate/valine-pyruvate aminotransferase
MTTYQPSEDKEIYQKCIGIARVIDNFSCSLQGNKINMRGGNPVKIYTMNTALFFKMDANEIINMFLKEGGTHE